MRKLYAFIAFYLPMYLLMPSVAPGTVLEKDEAGANLIPVAWEGEGKPLSPQPMPNTLENAVTALSGSRWPGVIDHLLQRPAGEDDQSSHFNIQLVYPSTGMKAVDADIRAWVEGIADAFQSHLDQTVIPDPDLESLSIPDYFLHDDDLNSEFGLRLMPAKQKFELWGDYKISRPSESAISITFEIWNYTNPDKGNLDILTLNYNLLNGQRLNLVDIFGKPEVALELMSAWSRTQLEPRLGALRRAKMLHDGTEPLPENFSSITLTPTGVQINFQTWQVAPEEAGIQKVDMPLNELLPSEPFLALWGQPRENS